MARKVEDEASGPKQDTQRTKAISVVTTGLSASELNKLALKYIQQSEYADAISCYDEILCIDPKDADAFNNRGIMYNVMDRLSEAIQDFKHAIAVRPTMAVAHASLGAAYHASGDVEAAVKNYKQALHLQPDFPLATCNLLCALQRFCCWDDRDKLLAEVEGIVRKQISMSVAPSVLPFGAISYPFDPVLTLEISRKHASNYSLIASRFALPPFNHANPIPIRSSGGSNRLRIGYVSSDFAHHPLGHLMGSVFGMHNRENIEVFCYALTPTDGSEWRKRIQHEAEHFVDVSSLTSDKIAKKINDDKIDIAVDLNGYKRNARSEIFAMQPAPIQVSCMGFPSTMGATYIHYLVTDEFVSPLRYEHFYSEKLVHMPHSYFVNDYKQKHLDVLHPRRQHKRSEYGLPKDMFIFACFNQLYKIDPEVFNIWCNILQRVPNSVLWLLRYPAAGESTLRAYAAARGVKPDQIIFTNTAMKHEHIRRCALADLFLDTLSYNAHTTGTDILWSGLPMVTLPLEKMATRVGGSLCLATGLGDEMIVNSMKEYEERAVYLALNPSKLRELTDKLKSVRMTCPLFDTVRWVKNLERAYFRMWNIHCSGQQPQHFKVTEDDVECPYGR